MSVTAAAAPRLVMRGIVKRYPTTVANDGVDLTVRVGEIHALIGENGAGKSTLMKIAYGVTRPDEGTLTWEGREVSIDESRGGAASGHRYGVPAFRTVRNADGGREHRACARREGRSCDARRPDSGSVGPIWAAGGSGSSDAQHVRGRAAARGDRSLPASVPAPPHHGRADIGAHAASGASAVRDTAPARERRREHPVHQSQARGDSVLCATRRRSCVGERSRAPRIRRTHRAPNWPD